MPKYEYNNLTIYNYWILRKYHKWKLNYNKQIIYNNQSQHDDHEFIELSFHFCKFTSAAYAKIGLSLFYPVDTICSAYFMNATDAEMMSNHAGILPQDIIDIYLDESDKQEEYNEKGDLDHPKYFIALDHSTQSIVLAIRGTLNYDDVMTDLCGFAESFEYMDCEGCYVHQGIYYGTKWLYETCSKSLLSILEDKKYKEYKLVITGHSLGGGTSYLMYLMLKNMQFKGKFPERRIQCWAFAPPPVFCPADALKPEHKDDIYVFINDNDIVPRLGVYGVLDKIKMLRLVDSIPSQVSMSDLYFMNTYKKYLRTKSGFKKSYEKTIQRFNQIGKNTSEAINSWFNFDFLSCMCVKSNEDAKSQLKNEPKMNTKDMSNIKLNIQKNIILNKINAYYDKRKNTHNILANRIMDFKTNYEKSKDGGTCEQYDEFNRLENESDNNEIMSDEFANDSNQNKFYQLFKKLELQFVDIQQKREEMDYNDINVNPKMTHLGKVFYIYEDKKKNQLSIVKVNNDFFSEILLDSKNDDHHMSGDYEHKFKCLLKLEKFEIKKNYFEIVEESIQKNLDKMKN